MGELEVLILQVLALGTIFFLVVALVGWIAKRMTSGRKGSSENN